MTKSIIRMKQIKRGCGFRRIGGTYVVGEIPTVSFNKSQICPNLPLNIPECPTCGHTIPFFRSIKKINPLELFLPPVNKCKDKNCPFCNIPGERAWIMWVGKKYYTTDTFINEAITTGVSKRVPFRPEGFKDGDWVYLAYPKVFEIPRKGKKSKWKPGFFCAFKAQQFERIIPEKKSNDQTYLNSLGEGITAVIEDPDKTQANLEKYW